MAEENNNNVSRDNYIDNFRRPTTPSPQPSKDPNFRQSLPRPLSRQSYLGGEVRPRPPLNPANLPHSPQTETINRPNFSAPSSPTPVSTPTVNAGPNYHQPQPQQLDEDIDSLFPLKPVQPGQTRVPASTLVVKEHRLPVGVYVIIALSLALFIVSFFNTANNKLVYSILTLIELLLSIGLVFKREDIRKYLGYAAGIVAISSVLLIIFFYLQASSTNSTYEKNYLEIKSKAAQSLSYQQKQTLASEQAKVIARRNKQESAEKLFYPYAAIVTIEGALSLIYLRKDEVQGYFQPKTRPGQAA